MNNQKGLSLIEIMLTLAIFAVVGVSIASLNSSVFKFTSQMTDKSDTDIYNIELKNKMKFTDSIKKGTSYCKERLNSVLTPSRLKTMVDSGDKVEIAGENFLDKGVDSYAKSKIVKTTLRNFKITYQGEGFVKSDGPGEFIPSKSNKTEENGFKTYIVQADVITQFAPAGNLNNLVDSKPLKMRFAIDVRSGPTYRLVDCGTSSLSNVIVNVESCKMLGQDFTFVYDKFDGKEFSGQCYAPRYQLSSPAAVTAFDVKNSTVSANSYIPIRGFLCNLAFQDKGLDFKYCTGVTD